MLWFSGIMVVIFGGLTLWLHDERFIKIKPTIYYAAVAALLLFGLLTRRNLLKVVLGTAYPGLRERGWYLLTRNWVVFFLVMAVPQRGGLADDQHRILGRLRSSGCSSR